MLTADYRVSVDGIELTDQLLTSLFQATNEGHSIARLKLRARPGRPAPLSVGQNVDVTLDDELYAAASEEADRRGVSLAELIRIAIHASV